MQLKIRNWPALASHGVVLIVGFFIANLRTASDSIPFRMNHDLIAFPMKLQNFSSRKIESITMETSLVLIESVKNTRLPCFNLIDTVQLLQINPTPVIGIKKTKKKTLLKLINVSKRKEILIFPKSEWENLKKCKSTVEVTYGT